MNSFYAQFQRVLEASGCRTQFELADFLGVRQAFISDAKRRQIIPDNWCMKLQETKGINPKWIKTGRGNRID